MRPFTKRRTHHEREIVESLPPEPEGPLRERIQCQIAWYKTYADLAMHRYYIMKIAQVGLTLSIPVILQVSGGPGQDSYYKSAAALAAFGAAVLESVLQLTRSHDNWKRWRETEMALRREVWLHYSKCGEYKLDRGRQALLAKNVEAIMAREHLSWIHLDEQKQNPNDDPDRRQGVIV